MSRLITIIFIITINTVCFSQSNIPFVWDQSSSSIASAKNLTSLHKVLFTIENKYIKTSYWDEDNLQGKSLGIGYRLAKTILLDFQVDFLTILTQHEVFGHGYRLREFEYINSSYEINFAPPYGSGEGLARAGNHDYNRVNGIHENIAIRSGGMESNSVLSTTLKNRWLETGEINFRESLLYFFSFHDYTIYILRTNSGAIGGSSNDVQNYLRSVNASRGIVNEENYLLTINDLSNRTKVNFINTYQIFALYTYFKTYLIDGDEKFRYPMISIGKINWMPSIRFGLTPFGSEFIIENSIKNKIRIFEFNTRLGDNKLYKNWGTGISLYQIISENLKIRTNLDIWSQPNLELGGESILLTNSGIGGRIRSEIFYNFNKNFPVGIYGQLGYKSNGFIEGERLSKGIILRIGLTLKPKHKST